MEITDDAQKVQLPKMGNDKTETQTARPTDGKTVPALRNENGRVSDCESPSYKAEERAPAHLAPQTDEAEDDKDGRLPSRDLVPESLRGLTWCHTCKLVTDNYHEHGDGGIDPLTLRKLGLTWCAGCRGVVLIPHTHSENASKRKARPSPSASSPNERKRAKPTGAESDAGSMGSTIPYPPAPSKTSSNSTIAYSPAPSNESSDEEEPPPDEEMGEGGKNFVCIPPPNSERTPSGNMHSTPPRSKTRSEALTPLMWNPTFRAETPEILTTQAWKRAGERRPGAQDPRIPEHAAEENGSCCSYHYKSIKGFATIDGATYALGEQEGRKELPDLDARILLATNDTEGGSPHPLQGLIGAMMMDI